MQNYREKFLELFDEIKNNKQIDIIDIQDNIPETDPETAETMYKLQGDVNGFPLEKYFLPYYDICEGTALHWIANDPSIAGEFSLVNISEATFRKDRGMYHKDTDVKVIEFLKSCGIIDNTPSSGNGTSTLIDLNSKEFPPDLYYYDVRYGGDCHKLTINYGEYIDMLLLTKGMALWQYLFCDFSIKKPERQDLADGLTKNIENLKKVFPDHDYTVLEERLQTVKNSLA